MKEIKYALLTIKKNISNEKELKSSFIISIVGMIINNAAFLVLWYYFGKTVGVLNGWAPLDIFGLYGFSMTSYGVVMSVFAGVFKIPEYIRNGSLDRFLLTPKNILLKISTSSLTTSAFGDCLFGIICFIVFAFANGLSVIQLLVALLLMIFASAIFYSFLLIAMSISFYLMDGENVSHGFYGMFITNSLYHGGAFTGVLRLIFIVAIPSLLIGAVPVEILKSLDIIKLLLLGGATLIWFILSILFFYKSLKKYESSSLFGFGS